MSEQTFDKTKLNTINRLPARGSYDKSTIKAIAAEAKVAHLAWSDESTGLPQCVPMLAALEEIDGDLYAYFHGHSPPQFFHNLFSSQIQVIQQHGS